MTPAAKRAALISVLIVEDVDEMREMLEQVIAAIPGFKVSGAARNGWEARLELGRRSPSVVLLDEVLPGESSVDLLAEIRQLGVPCVLMTGVENPTHGVPAGAWGRITKPDWDRLDEGRERLRVALMSALSG
jgi:DNA-binding response OmpR family regulator